ncbi:MAG TPA: hypothetical protein VF306_11160 [Pirellulales bacterium]
MIHCDEVFDILTRGPFPTGAPSDGIVEAHLNHCQSCRELAEALRPAMELLQEAISPEESDSLPRYAGTAQPRAQWGDHSQAPLKTQSPITRPVARAAAGPRPAADASHWRSAARFAAAACIGLAVAGMLRQITLSHGGAPPSPAAVACAANWHAALSGGEWVEKQKLREGCRDVISGYTLAVPSGGARAGDVMQLTCCWGCHDAHRGQTLSAERVGGFVLACQACH